jgi:hypothetical protein
VTRFTYNKKYIKKNKIWNIYKKEKKRNRGIGRATPFGQIEGGRTTPKTMRVVRPPGD